MDYTLSFDNYYLLAVMVHLFEKQNVSVLIAIPVTKWKHGCLKPVLLAQQRIITWKHSSVVFTDGV